MVVRAAGLCLFCVSLALSPLSLAQQQPKPDRAKSAKERCKAERGVDCETPQGLNEWELLERSRQEAVRDGSRHRPANRPAPATTNK